MSFHSTYTSIVQVLDWIRNQLNGLCHSLIPETDDTYDLGSSTKEFKDAYLDGVLSFDAARGNVASKTEAYTLTDDDFLILCNSTGGAFTLTLPAASGRTGQIYVFKKTDAGVNAITIDGNAAEKIDGAATNAEMDAQYDTLTIICDGSNWHIIGRWIH